MTHRELLKYAQELLAENTVLHNELKQCRDELKQFKEIGFTNGAFGGHPTYTPLVTWVVPDKLVLFARMTFKEEA